MCSVYLYLYQELVQTFSFRKKNIFASFERVCLQTLARIGIGKAVRKVKNMKKVSLDKLSQTLSPPTALHEYFSDSMCICPTVCPAERMLARRFRICCVHDKYYKTGLNSPLVGAYRTQLKLIEFKLY